MSVDCGTSVSACCRGLHLSCPRLGVFTRRSGRVVVGMRGKAHVRELAGSSPNE